MPEYRLIDADAHTVEPPHIWERWLPARFRDRAPRLVKDTEGGDAWLFEPDKPPMTLGLVSTPGKRFEEFKWTGSTYAGMRRSCYDGAARLEDMDFDGIDAEFLYPMQRTMAYFMANEDVEFHRAGIQAYNTWLHQEFCAADPTRLFGLAQIPNLGTDEAVAELRRCREMGFRGAILSAWPSGNDDLSAEDDPFWAAAEEMGMPVSIHINVQRRKFFLPTMGSGSALGGAYVGMTLFPPILVGLIVDGLFERFPRLTLVGAEVQVGWIPELLEQLDDSYWRNRTHQGIKLRELPSEYFHRNFVCTFIKDRTGIKNRHDIGVRNMAWSTDFPHHGNDWPYSRKVIKEMFDGVPEAETHLITCGNAARIYGLTQAAVREPALV
jgi:predicted TIM-barrel fold metal-dependent hydrolase